MRAVAEAVEEAVAEEAVEAVGVSRTETQDRTPDRIAALCLYKKFLDHILFDPHQNNYKLFYPELIS